MLNHRGPGDRIEVTAAANRTAGVPVIEQGFVGIPETTVSSGDVYTLRLTGEFEITDPGSAAVGNPVYLTAADNTVSLTAAAGKRHVGRVSRISSQKGVGAGKCWFILYRDQIQTA